jgi:hypothetical protein
MSAIADIIPMSAIVDIAEVAGPIASMKEALSIESIEFIVA